MDEVSKGGHYGAAITAQVVLVAYFELCILIPLGRWDDQPGNNIAFNSGNMICLENLRPKGRNLH